MRNFHLLALCLVTGGCVGTTCDDGLTIELDPPLAGENIYRLEITADGTRTVCETSDTNSCSFWTVWGNENHWGSIVIKGTPAVVEVTVSHEGATVAEGSVTPSYSDEPTEPGRVRIEGCRTARESVATR